MAPARFEEVLAALGWSRRGLAARLNCAPALVDRWAAKGTAPRNVEVWLEVLASFHKANPPPTDWKRRGSRR